GLQQTVHRSKLLVKQALQDQDGEDSRNGVRKNEKGAVEPPALQILLFQNNREQHPDRKSQHDGKTREGDRPQKHAHERDLNSGIRQDPSVVIERTERSKTDTHFLSLIVNKKALFKVRLDHRTIFLVGK